MTSWAMLAVELLNPYMPELASHWEDCEFCRRSLQSVMSADLLLFKTVVAGDSWGKAEPAAVSYKASERGTLNTMQHHLR